MLQKFERAKRSFRVYQILKLIRREMIIEFRKSIPDNEVNLGLKKQIIESFLQCHNPDSKAQKNQKNGAPIIRNDLLFSLIRLCGGSKCLSQEECLILMKKVHINQKIQNHQRSLDLEGPQNNPLAFIQLNNFIKAVEMVMNDTKLDPYILTYKLLLTFYSGQELINMTDFKKFFARFEFYFQGNDIRMFLKEVALL